MTLEIRKDAKWFYGRPMIDGKREFVNLGVEIRGRRPKSLRGQGDVAFERSRERALLKLKEVTGEFRKKGQSEELLQKIHAIRTGSKVGAIALDEMFDVWRKIPRKRRPSTRYVAQVNSLFKRFAVFVRGNFPKAIEMADVQSDMAEAFLRSEEKRGVSGKTYNNELILLRSVFGKLKKKAGLTDNPFEGIPTKVEDTVFRRPFSPDELSEIIEVVQRKEHAFIRPAIITGMCTAMRKGDCCLLKRRETDLKARFVRVTTSKTGERVDIPLFPLLYDEIKSQPSSRSEYVFPELAKMYRSNPDGITWRVRKVLKEAGFYDRPSNGSEEDPNHRGNLHVERKVGLKKASVIDFHSFRVTWVTLALLSGVEMELIKKVTGHRTVDVVLTHYFQPGREDFRRALESKMPQLMITGQSDVPTIGREELAKVLRLAKEQNTKNWKERKAQIVEIVSRFVA